MIKLTNEQRDELILANKKDITTLVSLVGNIVNLQKDLYKIVQERLK